MTPQFQPSSTANLAKKSGITTHSFVKDPYTGITILSVLLKGHNGNDGAGQPFTLESKPGDASTKMTIIPSVLIPKDIEMNDSEGRLLISSKLFGKNCQISFCFDDDTVLSKQVKPAGDGRSFVWYFIGEECEWLLLKHLREIKAISSNQTFVFNLAKQGDTPQDYSKIFQTLLEEFLAVAGQKVRWFPSCGYRLYELGEDDAELEDSARECCSVYLMKDTINGYYKIGMSNNPEYRESTLQSEKPSIELVCHKEYPSRDLARAIESSFHRVYDDKRIRGEWFSLDEQDVLDIKQTLA